jgi:hypothetical protein
MIEEINQISLQSKCTCVNLCGNLCENKSFNIVCNPHSCSAGNCSNRGAPFSIDHFGIEELELKGTGLVAKKNISR